MTEQRWRSGGCHCGAVRFQALMPDEIEVEDCNCSMCAKSAYLHAIVPEAHFKLEAGQAALTSYRFNTGTAEHLFCGRCGIKPFYRPRSNPDGYSVNFRCLDDGQGITPRIVRFDGQNWEANGASLADKSKA